jgi:hypothetical protein
MKRLAILAHNVTSTNRGLLAAASALGLDAFILTPEHAARRLRRGDVALGRLDVLPTLAGLEPALNKMRILDDRGVVLLHDRDFLPHRARTSARTRAMSGLWAIPMLIACGPFAGGVVWIAWECIPAWCAADLSDFQTAFAPALRRVDRLQPALLVV